MKIFLFIILVILLTCNIYYKNKLIFERLIKCCSSTIKINCEEKIKVWITSDKFGTYIWKDKPVFDKSAGLFCMETEENYPFKVDNSKHLYKEPTEVYISIEEKHINKPKRANKVKNMFKIKNITE